MKIAVVTGASSGLGREFVRQISKKYRTLDEIWVMARRENRLRELEKEISNVKIRSIAFDITDKRSIMRYKNLLEKFKPSVRLLVNVKHVFIA